MSIKYRPDIDGLRAVSVSAVMIYHAVFLIGDYKLLKGGFLGVDVFFVISGYLITSLILREIDTTGKFSFLQFYMRRARRILPVLLTVMLVSLPVGAWILLPSAFTRMTESFVASLFFASNHFWHMALGAYGAGSGLKQPFLHTWSLAVEEQFYILFPIIFVTLAFRARRMMIPSVIALVVVGLIFAQFMTEQNRFLSFYWLPSRVWELGSGVLLACLVQRDPTLGARLPLARFGAMFGLALIVGSMFTVGLLDHLHPGLITVPTILGSCLVILCGVQTSPTTRMLSSAPFVWLGKLSYSAYLWHYPIFAFARIMDPDPGVFQKFVWIALTLGMSMLSYRFVEQPLRRTDIVPTKPFVGGMAVLVSGVLALGISAQVYNGFPQRFPSLSALYGGSDQIDNDILRDQSWSILKDLAAEQGMSKSTHDRPSKFEETVLWYSPDPATRKVLVVGDSHSKDLFNAFHLNRDLYEGMEFARFGMNNEFPGRQIDRLIGSPNFQAADVVLLTTQSLGVPERLEALAKAARTLKETGKEIVLVSNRVGFPLIDDMPVYDWYIRQTADGEQIDLPKLAYEARASDIVEWDERFREIADAEGLPLLEQSRLVCDDSQDTCTMATPDGLKMYYDFSHYSVEGARYFGRLAWDEGWLRSKG